jgi:uncharacterized protein (TIGR03086 family)
MSDFVERYVTLADPLAAYDEVVAAVGELARGTRIDQYALPTPCEGWTVHKILDHLVETLDVYGDLARGVQPTEGEERRYDDPADAFAIMAARTRSAFAAPDYLELAADTPIGPQPGKAVVQHVVNELTAHGWDLARATGRSTDLVPDIAADVLASWQAFLGTWDRTGNPNFAAERTPPDDATAADRVAAFLGRAVQGTGGGAGPSHRT